MMVRHIASQTSMNESGPEASAPTPFTGAPIGRRVEKSCPMPPPCCMVSAASFTFSKMPAMSSRDRAHDEAVEQRDGAAGAGAGDHPSGRQELEALQRLVEPAGPGLGIALGRRQGARDPPPRGFEIGCRDPPEASRNRYFMSQIRWEIGAQSIPRKVGKDRDINKRVLFLFPWRTGCAAVSIQRLIPRSSPRRRVSRMPSGTTLHSDGTVRGLKLPQDAQGLSTRRSVAVSIAPAGSP